MSQAATLAPEVIEDPEPEIGKRHEIIDGRKVEKPPMGRFQNVVAAVLDQLLGAFARSNRLGRVLPEMLFRSDPKGKRHRRPDVAFVSYARWPRESKVDSGDGFEVVPELAIEVVSPTNRADEVVIKVRDYFTAGVLRVWVVYPSVRQVYVYDSPRTVTILGEGEELDGGDLIPGLRLGLVELFEDGAED